jgi:predicted dehydrogenase
MKTQPNRREFLKAGAAAATTLAALGSGTKAFGAGKKLRAGFIGIGNRGSQLLEPCLGMEDVEIAALCDVYKPYLHKWSKTVGAGVPQYGDFRELLARPDIDAVFIATPDHWHALQTIMACEAGKDVYVEKPLSRTVVEGRRMVEAARRTNRIVQVGTHRRSSDLYLKLAELIQKGGIGKVTLARCYRINNMFPDGIGKAPDSNPPSDLDWDMWIGPRAMRPYRETIAPYKFRWWSDYSSQIGNWGVHYFDAIRWVLGEQSPSSVSAHGGKYVLDDDRTVPDTLEATYEFASGRLLLFGQYEATSGNALPQGEVELRGTLGTIYAGDNYYELIPSQGGQFNKDVAPIDPVKVKLEDQGDLTARHIRNFIECIHTRSRPNADVEEGHRSTLFSHLGNIALATKTRLDWDPLQERFTNSEAANGLLHYEYRPPWKLV